MAKKKRHRAKEHRTTMKLTEHTEEWVRKLSNATGWSASACVNFLLRAGVDELYHKGEAVPAMRQTLTAAIEAYEAQRYHERAIAQERAKLAAARKAMDQALKREPEPMPDKPPADAPVIVSPKRKPGRPRKNPQPETEQNLKTPETHAETQGEAGVP